MIVRLGNGISYFYVFHFAPILDDASYQETLDTIQTAINTTKGWPTNDFFATTLSYDAWRSQHFTATGRADPAISGEGENPDGDGLVNLLGNDPRPPSHRPPTPAIPKAPGCQAAALSSRPWEGTRQSLVTSVLFEATFMERTSIRATNRLTNVLWSTR